MHTDGLRWTDDAAFDRVAEGNIEAATELRADIYAKDDDDGRMLLHFDRKLRTFRVVTELGADIFAKDDGHGGTLLQYGAPRR